MLESRSVTTLSQDAPDDLKEVRKVAAASDQDILPDSVFPEQIQRMEKDEILGLQRHFNLGTEWGKIRYPREWIPESQPYAQGTINLYRRLSKTAATAAELELGVITAMRMVLIAFCVPTKSGSKSAKRLAPTTILTRLNGPWINFIKFSLSQPDDLNGNLLSRMGNYCYKSRELEEAKRFKNLQTRGLWSDVDLPSRIETSVEESNRDVLESETNFSNRGRPKDPYLPLPDEFVHQAGRYSAWIINVFTPMLLTCYEQLVELINRYRVKFGPQYAYPHLCAEFLSKYVWTDALGQSFQGFPFPVKVHFGKRVCEWPPSNLQELQQYAMMAQMANFFVIALSAGPRASEILSFRIDCLIESRDGVSLANGRTYKIVDPFEGEMRDWPMPQIAVQGLQYQSRLSAAISGQFQSDFIPAETPLWRLFHSRGAGAALGSKYNAQMRLYVSRLGLEQLVDNQALTHHRFRKTIARLVALAQVHAPKILMDIFGHKSIEMTMHYILADPSILSEMRAVRKELVLIMAKKAIQNAASNGGPASEHIRAAVKQIKFQSSDQYGAENEDDLAMMLTGQGVYWIQPRPGVICTKLADQVGPCAKGKSQPNPARCQSDCLYRLEEADNRSQVNASIEEIVRNIQRAWAYEDEILAEIWSGQLMTNLKRFDDLKAKWSMHPTVDAVLNRVI